jgi:hypothetical protein
LTGVTPLGAVSHRFDFDLNRELKEVDHFKYLGSVVTRDQKKHLTRKYHSLHAS